MSNFNWGILGPGGIAKAFATDLHLLDGHTVAAVGSRTLKNAQGSQRHLVEPHMEVMKS